MDATNADIVTADAASKEKFRRAQRHVVNFGYYKGREIDGIAETDEGLLWLDDALSRCDTLRIPKSTREAIGAYLAWPSIANELEIARDAAGEGDEW